MLNERELREKLKNIRITQGLTEAQVATSLGKASNSYVNRIENGPTKINIEILDELCSLYKVNPLELFRGQRQVPDAKPKGFFEKNVFRATAPLEDDARSQIKDLLPTLRKIGRVQGLLERKPISLSSLSNDLGDINLKNPGKAIAQAKEAAVLLRRFFKIDQNSPIDVASFCWSQLNIPICGLDLGKDCWGLHSSDKLGNPLIVYSSAHKFNQRNAFTVAHEIGHFLFAHDYLSVDCDDSERSLIEKVANAFAQEFLVPAVALREVFDELGFSLVSEIKPHHVVALSEHFKVSFFMMLVCLKGIGKINSAKFDELKDFCLNRLDAAAESLKYNPRYYFSPAKSLKDQLRELVLIALRKGLISFFEASELVDEPTEQLKAAL